MSCPFYLKVSQSVYAVPVDDVVIWTGDSSRVPMKTASSYSASDESMRQRIKLSQIPTVSLGTAN